MTRLPQIGSDKGTWGTILNDFLGQAHNPDGTIKNGSVSNEVLDSATQAILGSVSGKVNQSDLAAVATSGSYVDLTNKPTIPTQASDIGAATTAQITSAVQAQATTDATIYLKVANAATVATSGAYADLTGKPAAPSAASDIVAGVVELATVAETVTGTDAIRAVTPAGVAAVTSNKVTGAGITNIRSLTQTQFNALTPDASTLYLITGP